MTSNLIDALKSIRSDCIKCVKDTATVHGSTSKLLSVIGEDRSWIEDFVVNSFERIEQAVSKETAKCIIPRLYHKIWLTDQNNPSLPPSDFIDKLVDSTKNMDSSWTIVFWSNNNEASAFIRKALQGSHISTIVADFADAFRYDSLYSTIIRLLNDKKYVLAGDVLKVAILNRFGGIYSDLGLQISQTVLELSRYADYIFFFGHAVFLQTSMMAAPPSSALLTIFANIMNRPEAIPRDLIVLGDCVTATDEVRVFSGVCATICLLLFSNKNSINLLMPDKSEFHTWEAKGSWYTTTDQRGNSLISNSNPTFLSESLYAEAEKKSSFSASIRNISDLRAHILELCEAKHQIDFN